MASKPQQVKEKIVMGKMNKFYEENCLLQMEFGRSDIFQGSVETVSYTHLLSGYGHAADLLHLAGGPHQAPGHSPRGAVYPAADP